MYFVRSRSLHRALGCWKTSSMLESQHSGTPCQGARCPRWPFGACSGFRASPSGRPTAGPSSVASRSSRSCALLAKANEPAAQPAAATPTTGPTTKKYRKNAGSPRETARKKIAASANPADAPHAASVEGTSDQTDDGPQRAPALRRKRVQRRIRGHQA